MVLLLTRLEDQDGLGDYDTGIGWGGQALELLDTLYFQAVNGGLGSSHGRDSFSELSLGAGLLSLSVQGQGQGLSLLLSGD